MFTFDFLCVFALTIGDLSGLTGREYLEKIDFAMLNCYRIKCLEEIKEARENTFS